MDSVGPPYSSETGARQPAAGRYDRVLPTTPPTSAGALVSEIKVVRIHAGEREDRGGDDGHQGLGAVRRRPRGDRGPGQRRPQGPRLRAGRRRRGRGRGDRQRRRPRHPAALDRTRDGPGRAGALPRRQARHRPADRERLLLRLRRRDPVRARGPREDRDPDAQDHQGGAALLPTGHHRRRGDRRAEGRALQDRADRAQGLGGSQARPPMLPREPTSRSAPAS